MLIGLLVPGYLWPQNLSQDSAERFIQTILDGKAVDGFVDANALETSRRLGIHYENTEKYLISYEIDPGIRQRINRGELDYTLELTPLADDFVRLDFLTLAPDYQQSYFFKHGKMVPPVTFYCRAWPTLSSRFFRFHISNPDAFNAWCMMNLDDFVLATANMLQLAEPQVKLLQTQKIDYYLCKDPQEIKELTGFDTRGMYNLAYDYIITTFNAHYHELVHLLVNYKLGTLPLYTHPFFQEGLAVALGGRGGKEPRVILELGRYLYQSGFMDYKELLNKTSFYQTDPSMSYPASGLYHCYLIAELGIERYLAMYRALSGTAQQVDDMNMSPDELPEQAHWQTFLDGFAKSPVIRFEQPGENSNLIFQDHSSIIRADSDRYYFQIRDTLLVPSKSTFEGYQSIKFDEIMPGQYNQEKYLIIAGPEEISVYNLYSNNLVASYALAFSIPPVPVPQEDGYFLFSIDKGCFDEPLEDLLGHDLN